VQGSLFIVDDYLGVKRVKIGFFHKKNNFKNKKMAPPDHVHVRGA